MESDPTARGPSIRYIMLSRYFGPILTLPSPCHTLSHISGPPKYVTHLGSPIFSSTCIHTSYNRGFVLVHGGFVQGFLSEKFYPGDFCPSTSVRIHPFSVRFARGV